MRVLKYNSKSYVRFKPMEKVRSEDKRLNQILTNIIYLSIDVKMLKPKVKSLESGFSSFSNIYLKYAATNS